MMIEGGGLSERGGAKADKLGLVTVAEKWPTSSSAVHAGACCRSDVRTRAAELLSRATGVQQECEAGMEVVPH